MDFVARRHIGFSDPIVLLITILLFKINQSAALQNLIPNFKLPQPSSVAGPFKNNVAMKQARLVEEELLAAIQDVGSRLSNSERISNLISQLETDFRAQSIPEPAIAPQIYGRWRLIYTTNTDTSSPIQRKAVDAQKFQIYQDILVNDKNQLVVKQIVKFSDSAELSVDALASTAAYPLPELTDRKSTGKVLGLNILGVSLVGDEAEEDSTRPNSRISFVFDEGNFDFGSFKVPYPVPFRFPLLRDWVKGWIDTTWLSERLRISRGNKGTTFVLLKESVDINKQ